MIPRRRAHLPPRPRDVRRLLDEYGASADTMLRNWETRFAQYLSMPEAAAMNSGRRALMLILEHLRLREGDEVVVPAYTFGEILPPMQRLGIKLLPADIDARTLNATAETIARRITPRTRAILMLHVFGAPARVDEIVDLAQSRGIVLVEDCAHALGATVGGRRVGTFGHAAFFSLEMNKLINTFGGGMLVSEDAALVARARDANRLECPGSSSVLRKMRATQIEHFLFRTRLSFPFLYAQGFPRWRQEMNALYRRGQRLHQSHERYSDAQAQLGLDELETLDARLALRRQRAAQLREALKADIRHQEILLGTDPTFYMFVAMLPCPAVDVRRRLLLKGIDAGIESEIMDDCSALLGFQDCPGAAQVFKNAISLPMYDGITEGEVACVADALNRLI